MSDGQQKEVPPVNKQAAALLRRMADRVELNAAEDFGGCFVIIPPDGPGAEMLILDSQKDPAVFYSNLKTMAEIQIEELTRGGGHNMGPANVAMSWRGRGG